MYEIHIIIWFNWLDDCTIRNGNRKIQYIMGWVKSFVSLRAVNEWEKREKERMEKTFFNIKECRNENVRHSKDHVIRNEYKAGHTDSGR